MQPTNYTIALFVKENNKEYQLTNGANTIGRSRSNTVNIKECKFLSRKHCTICKYLNHIFKDKS
ncbi:hypothetical protein DICPUDRAFT_160368 [Dictyostelium purpureum]|uniref:Uncharacterized protein n=1 Tax=Dictyostelium purpureum TaxID=5786 RepID=F1A678_DICPU|nr:uncharacterized protein DICPUDRAFT_160368 [Dictyostelium purpureum]EGC28301.1 hypothetical protein DICPUDRAFT_160368 [Dictyostelium purpureum]|eukprot:XP_003295171.1 hypothetical protein DICPUDRAFT_160368 [Dictyostelium purpureum]